MLQSVGKKLPRYPFILRAPNDTETSVDKIKQTGTFIFSPQIRATEFKSTSEINFSPPHLFCIFFIFHALFSPSPPSSTLQPPMSTTPGMPIKIKTSSFAC